MSRRIKRLALASIAVVAGAAVVLWLAHTDTATETVRRIVASQLGARLGTDVQIDALRYSLWRRDAQLEGLTMTGETLSLSVGQARLRWRAGGAEIQIETPSLDWHPKSPPPSSSSEPEVLPAPPWWLHSVRISGGVASTTSASSRAFTATGIGINLTPERAGGGPRSGELTIESIATSGGESSPQLSKLEQLRIARVRARISWSEQSLSWDQLRAAPTLEGDSASIENRGSLRKLRPLEMTSEFTMSADGAFLAHLPPENSWKAGLNGRLSSVGQIHSVDGRLVIEATVDSQLANTAWGSLPASAKVSVSPETLELSELQASVLGGRVEANGILHWPVERAGRAAHHLNVALTQLELTQLTAMAGMPAPVHSRISGELSADWDAASTSWRPAKLTGRIRLSPPPPEQSATASIVGSIQLQGSEGRLEASTAGLRVANGTIDFTLAVSEDDSLSGRLRLSQTGMNTWVRPWLGREVDIDSAVDSAVNVVASLKGTLASPHLDARLEARLGAARNETTSLPPAVNATEATLLPASTPQARVDAEMAISSSGVKLDSLTVVGPGIQGHASGDLLPGKLLDFRAELVELHWNEIPETWTTPFAGYVPAVARGTASEFDGIARATMHVSGSIEDPRALVTLRVDDGRLGHSSWGGSLSIDATRSRLATESVELHVDGGKLEGSAEIDLDSKLTRGNLAAQSLPIGSVLRSIYADDGEDLSTEPTPLHRSLRLIEEARLVSAQWTGPWKAPNGTLHVDFVPTAEGTDNWSLSAESNGDKATASIGPTGPGSQPWAEAVLSLEDDYPLRIASDLGHFPFQSFLAVLGDTVPRVRVDVHGQLGIEMSGWNPASIAYRVEVDDFLADLFGVVAGASAPFVIAGDLEHAHISDLDLIGADTAISLRGTIPLSESGVFELETRGQARLEWLNPAIPVHELRGLASLDLHVDGAASSPRISGELSITEGGGTVADVELSAIDAVVVGGPDGVILRSLTGRAFDGDFSVDGVLPLPHPSEESPARLRFRVTQADLTRRLLAESTASTSVLVSVDGEMVASHLTLDALSAHGDIVELRAGLGASELVNAENTPWTLRGGELQIERLNLVNRSGGASDLTASLQVRLTGPSLNGLSYESRVQGVFDQAVLNPMLSADGDLAISGLVDLDMRMRSSPDGPALSGYGRVENSQLVVRELGLVLTDIAGEMRFEERGARLQSFSARAGGGRISAEGDIELVGARMKRANISAVADGIRLNYPEGLRSVVGGSLRFTGADHQYLLSGDIALSQGNYSQDFNLASGLLSSVQSSLATFTPVGSFEHRTRLDVRARTVDDIRIDSNLAQMQASANVRLIGTLAAPELGGFLTAQEGGTFRLASNQYTIDSARLQLDGYPLETPRVEIEAQTRVSETDIQVSLRGPLDNLTTELRSADTALSRGDLASLLMTGRRLDEVSTGTGGILGDSVADYFGSALGRLTSSTLEQALPFDQFSVQPVLIRQEAEPGARLTLGKNLTDELSITYSLLLNNTEDQIWIVDYLLPKQLKLRAVRSSENEFIAGLSQTVRFDFFGRTSSSNEQQPQPHVSSVHLQALGRSEGLLDEQLSLELASSVDIEPNDRFDYWKMSRTAERLRRELVDRGFWGAFVDFVSQPDGTEGELLRVEFRAVTGAQVQLVSAETADDELRSLVREGWDARLPLSIRLADANNRVRRHLFANGYYGATVELSAEETPGDVERIRLRVETGAKGSAVVVDFPGRSLVSDDQLRSSLPRATTGEFYDLAFHNTGRLKQTLTLAYANQGFLQTQVNEPVIRVDQESNTLRVDIAIDEGTQTTTGSIRWQGVRDGEVDVLQAMIPLEAGTAFSVDDFIQTRTRVNRFYRRLGFRRAEVDASLELVDEGEIQPVFDIRLGPMTRVGEILIAGNHVTKPEVIRRRLTFAPGDPLRSSELVESQLRLYELGTFHFADVRPRDQDPGDTDPVPSPGASEDDQTAARYEDVLVEVDESSDLELDYGFRVGDNRQYSATFETRSPNLFGKAYQAGFTAQLNESQRLFRTSFLTPFLGKYDLDSTAFLTRILEEDEFFTTRSWALTFQQRKRLGHRFGIQWSYIFNRSVSEETLPLSPFSEPLSVNRSRVVFSLIQDTRDNLVQPAAGRFWNVSYELAPPQLGSELNFQKLFGQFFTYRTIDEGWVWASSYRIGVAQTYANSSVLIAEDRFQAGGASSIRGFARNSLGPPDPIFVDSGGKAVVIMNQELRFPLIAWLRGGVFYDVGNVFEEVSSISVSDMRHTAGVGLRLVLPFGLVRFDWATVINPQPFDRRQRFIFSLGHAF